MCALENPKLHMRRLKKPGKPEEFRVYRNALRDGNIAWEDEELAIYASGVTEVLKTRFIHSAH
jgi:hypothetical protein